MKKANYKKINMIKNKILIINNLFICFCIKIAKTQYELQNKLLKV